MNCLRLIKKYCIGYHAWNKPEFIRAYFKKTYSLLKRRGDRLKNIAVCEVKKNSTLTAKLPRKILFIPPLFEGQNHVNRGLQFFIEAAQTIKCEIEAE